MTAVAILVLCVNALAPTSWTTRAQPSHAVDESGVMGYVLAPDGTPVSGGTVVILSPFAPTKVSIERSGHFRWLATRSGLVHIVVSVPGLASHRMEVTVPASRSLRLPVVRLERATYFRVKFVSAAGEPIIAPQLRQRSFDVSGNPMFDVLGDRISDPPDSDGAITVGPLSRGITTLALDTPFFAQTRLPDIKVAGTAKVLDGGTVVVQQPGSILHVDLVDAGGVPVAEHDVHLEDVSPRSPLAFLPMRTNQQGRATFDRLAAGQYRVRTSALERCANQLLAISRVVAVSGSGMLETRIVLGGRAMFRITSSLAPARSTLISASPEVPPPPILFGPRSGSFECRGTTDTEGRVTLTNFPPGPAHVTVHMANSRYVRPVDVSDGRELDIDVPEGFLAVRVVNALKNEPVMGATITWTGSGGRVEATTTATGDALLEGVGTAGGTLAVSAQGYQLVGEELAEPPGNLHDISLMPAAAATNLRPRVISTSGEPVAGAVVELISASPAAVSRVAVTDAKGVVTFADVPPGPLQLIASADGFVTSTIHSEELRTEHGRVDAVARVSRDCQRRPASDRGSSSRPRLE